MNLPTRSFTDIVRDMSAALTTSAGRLIDISIGSVLRAIIESNSAIVLWVQWLVLLTLQTTRAATSTGADLDSWVEDFSLSRLPATTASGTVTLTRFSGAMPAFVPVGMIIKTLDGVVSFSVTADASKPAWQSTLNGYSLAPGVLSIDLPISASVAGSSGNVLSNTITVLASATPGIDAINNGTATTGGRDPETDAALRIRFTNFFASRSRATMDSVEYAISLVGADLRYVILENMDSAGNVRAGNMLIVVDDGSGTLAEPMLNSLARAVDLVRPVGTTFSIQSPQIIQVQVGLCVMLSADLSVPVTQSKLRMAIEEYIHNLPIGGTLSITRISLLVYSTESRIVNISNVTLNGQTADLIAPPTTSFTLQAVKFT